MLVFTYGMLTNSNIMSAEARRLGAAELPGFAWEMLSHANVFRRPGNSVLGVLWEIDYNLLKQLDRREGYPYSYTREMVRVQHHGRTRAAWVYIMTRHHRRQVRECYPSEHYFYSVLEGLEESGIADPNLEHHDAYGFN